jgi:HTH-type transcriptional regulator/antitoxin HipB
MAYSARMDYLIQTAAQLSAHLRSLRKARGLTQAKLGDRVGLDQTRVAKIERDPRLVSVGQLLRILTALSVRVVLRTAAKQTRQADRPADDTADW